MKKLQLVSSNLQVAPPRAKWRYVSSLVALALVTGILGYQHWIRGPATAKEEAREAAEYQSAVDSAASRVEADFRRWSATTVVAGTAMTWSGASAKAMFIEKNPGGVSMTGRVFPPQWIAWARSPTGLNYRVTYMLDANLQPIVVDPPEVVSDDQVLSKLIATGHTDLISKFGLVQQAS